MATLPEIESAIKDYTKLPQVDSPVGVFVGGTSGIGLHTALQFAKATANCPSAATIYIVGRNKAQADAAKAEIERVNPSAKFQFLQHDLLYIEQAKRVTNIILTHENKINLLMVSQGTFPTPQRVLTDEGIDSRMALSYYSRWAIVNDLVPLLNKASESKESARVVTVLSAGSEVKPDTINVTDFGLINQNQLTKVLTLGPTYNTMNCFYFAQKYPKISFTHTFPGFVHSNLFESFSWYVRIPVKAIYWVGYYLNRTLTSEQSGEEHLYAGLVGKEFGPGPHIVSLANKKVDVIYDESKPLDFPPELLEKLWKHTEDVIETAVAKDQVAQ